MGNGGRSGSGRMMQPVNINMAPGTFTTTHFIPSISNVNYLSGVNIPDENLIPQRKHREEQLATICTMQQLLSPKNAPDGSVGMMGLDGVSFTVPIPACSLPDIFLATERVEKLMLPGISNQMNFFIEKALNGSEGEVLCDAYNLTITRRDVKTLAGLNWLNDQVCHKILFYFM